MINRAKICIAAGVWLVLVGVGSGARKDTEYRTQEFAFRYPADFKISVGDHGTIIRLVPRSQSAYWEDAIIIRNHNKKTEECDLPQDSQPDARDRRVIAGRRAYAYSGEDAAMNRATKTKGYIIETRTVCWRFELTRKGRPFHKFDLPKSELRRFEKQSTHDSKIADAALKTILNSFVLLPSAR